MDPYQLCSTSVLFSRYSQVNPMKSPASGAGNFREPRLLPQVEGVEGGGARSRVRVDHCVYAIREAVVPVSAYIRSSLNRVNEVEGPQCL
jgi:hypothetical protein